MVGAGLFASFFLKRWQAITSYLLRAKKNISWTISIQESSNFLPLTFSGIPSMMRFSRRLYWLVAMIFVSNLIDSSFRIFMWEMVSFCADSRDAIDFSLRVDFAWRSCKLCSNSAKCAIKIGSGPGVIHSNIVTNRYGTFFTLLTLIKTTRTVPRRVTRRILLTCGTSLGSKRSLL